MVTSLMRITKEDPKSHGENMSTHMSIVDQCFDDLSPPNSDSSHEAYSNSNFSERNYVSATHWTAILKNVSILRCSIRRSSIRLLKRPRSKTFKALLSKIRKTAKEHNHQSRLAGLTLYLKRTNR